VHSRELACDRGRGREKRKAEIGVSAFKEGEAGFTISAGLLRTREEAVTALSRIEFVVSSNVRYSRTE
jgi:hypothetical protein